MTTWVVVGCKGGWVLRYCYSERCYVASSDPAPDPPSSPWLFHLQDVFAAVKGGHKDTVELLIDNGALYTGHDEVSGVV